MRNTALSALLLAVVGLLLFGDDAMASPGMTTRVSVDSSGNQGNDKSYQPAISGNGRFVAFVSANALVPDDTNGWRDVFVHDRETGVTERVSVDSAGNEGNDSSWWPFSPPALSEDGRYVAFVSAATNLVPDDTNGVYDVFVHDRDTGATTRVSVSSQGVQGSGDSVELDISGDGRFVAFASTGIPGEGSGVLVHDRQAGSTTLVASGAVDIPAISGDGRYIAFQGPWHVYVYDQETGVIETVSVDSAGNPGNGKSDFPSISADGRYVAFRSLATNLVPGDTNGASDVFVHDWQTGVTSRVSVDSLGVQGNDWSQLSSISGDGRYVAFDSFASNLVPGDTNGWADTFVYDRQTGTQSRVSVASDGSQGEGAFYGGSDIHTPISGDGRYIAFSAGFNNLVVPDTNGSVRDVYVHDQDPDGDGLFDPEEQQLGTDPNNPDTDGDGSSDGAEVFMGTLPLVACPATPTSNDEEPDAWPPDFDDNQTVDIVDVLAFKPVFNSTFGDGVYVQRKDLNADKTINIVDVLALKPFFAQSCTP